MNLPRELINLVHERYLYALVATHSNVYIQDLPARILQVVREYDLFPLVKYKEYRTFSTATLVSSSLNWALRWGLLDVCEWILANTEYRFDTDSFLNHPQVLAAAGGHIDIMEWLIENYDIHPTAETFDTAAANGHLPVLEWLRAHRYTGVTLKTLWYAKNLNHTEIAEWLQKNYAL